MRREKELMINDRGRELRFKIREMSAIELNSWIDRMELLQRRRGLAGQPLNDSAGGEAANKLSMKEEFEQQWALDSEMLACCRRVDGGIEQICTPESVGGFIEDLQTLLTLRREALQLNMDFSEPEPVKSSGSPEYIHIGKPQLSPASLNP